MSILTYAVDTEIKLYPVEEFPSPLVGLLPPAGVYGGWQHRDYIHYVLMAHQHLERNTNHETLKKFIDTFVRSLFFTVDIRMATNRISLNVWY